MVYRAFDEGEASRRFVERASDEPENFEALAAAGFEALKWPESEELALEGMSLMEACELERSAATPARARDGESGRL